MVSKTIPSCEPLTTKVINCETKKLASLPPLSVIGYWVYMFYKVLSSCALNDIIDETFGLLVRYSCTCLCKYCYNHVTFCTGTCFQLVYCFFDIGYVGDKPILPDTHLILY